MELTFLSLKMMFFVKEVRGRANLNGDGIIEKPVLERL